MNHAQQILSVLATGREVPHSILVGITHRFGGRIYELRQRGIDISQRRGRSGQFMYRLRTPIDIIDTEKLELKQLDIFK